MLLITDGEIWDSDGVIEQAVASEHTLFTVGVGSSVAEQFVRVIAEQTGGACELVSPGEEMAERIHRHFQRLFQPRAKNIEISWPVGSLDTVLINTVYSGDTVHLFNRFSKRPHGKLKLTITIEDGQVLANEIDVGALLFPEKNRDEALSTLSRIAAHNRLYHMIDQLEAAQHAVRYQLISKLTNFLAVDVRSNEEKAENLPELRKVPGMLAAGWGGVGEIDSEPDSGIRFSLISSPKLSSCASLDDMADDSFDVPTFLRRQMDSGTVYEDAEPLPIGPLSKDEFITELNDQQTVFSRKLQIHRLSDLVDFGLPEEIQDELIDLINEGHNEKEVVILFLYGLIHSSETPSDLVSKMKRRVLVKAFKSINPADDLLAKVNALVEKYE